MKSPTKKPQALIVTLHKSLNFGAYLQAYALQEVLKSKGVRPAFLDNYGLTQSLKRYLVLLKPKDMTPSGLIFNAKKLRQFQKAEKKLNIRVASDSYDAAFLGSDEIWNVKNKSFASAPEFFGLNFPENVKKFSYAPSAGNSTFSDIATNEEIIAGLKGMDSISVRDINTLNLVKSILIESEVCSVLDPTFLYDFSCKEKELNIPHPYAIVYSYKMPPYQANEIRSYADRKGLILVSPGFHNAWCDLVLPCSPFQFLTLIKNSECVITDTFHGTVFSIKYRKNFISFSHKKEKVRLLLAELGLESSSVNDGDLNRASEIFTDYEYTDDILNKKIEASHAYLNKCVNLMSCGDQS